MATIVIADNWPLFRIGLESVFRSAGHVVVGKAANVEETILLVDQDHPDVVILDNDLAGGGARAVLAHLDALPLRPFVMLNGDSIDEDQMEEVQALRTHCIVGKNKAPTAYLGCLDSILSGANCRLIDQPPPSAAITPSLGRRLSRREIEVAQLVAQALRNDDMAERLNVTVGTVKVHLSRIYKKLGISSRSELILLMQKHPTA